MTAQSLSGNYLSKTPELPSYAPKVLTSIVEEYCPGCGDTRSWHVNQVGRSGISFTIVDVLPLYAIIVLDVRHASRYCSCLSCLCCAKYSVTMTSGMKFFRCVFPSFHKQAYREADEHQRRNVVLSDITGIT